MKILKKVLKRVLSNYQIMIIKDFKAKYFPSQNQKLITEQEKIELKRRKEFYKQFINQGELCYDVGANIGNRIKPLLDLGAKIIAVEPQESCYKYLEKKFGSKIKIVKKGLGEAESIKDFHISDATTISSFSEEWIDSVKQERFKNYNWDRTVKIEMTTLDKLIEIHGLPVFVKIDVEGYEAEVLKGLSKPIRTVSFEYTVPEQTKKVIECITIIDKITNKAKYNYSIGESMEMALNEWIDVNAMKEHVKSNNFIKTGFGDIYVTMIE